MFFLTGSNAKIISEQNTDFANQFARGLYLQSRSRESLIGEQSTKKKEEGILDLFEKLRANLML